MRRILVMEDDRDTAEEIRWALAEGGYHVEVVHDGAEGLRRLLGERWDALVLDRMLPSLDGLSVIKAMRQRDVLTPALVVSALDSVGDRITGLRAGGDDYLIKPFALGELSARVDALVRRPGAAPPATILELGSLTLDLIGRTVRAGPLDLDLLPRELQILEHLMRRADQVVTRKMLLEDVFGYRFELKTNLVDVHVGRLRRKLEAAACDVALTTVKGIGFRLHAAG